MANTFLRKTSRDIGNVAVTVGDYTVTSNLGAVVVGLSISNTTGDEIGADVIITNGVSNYYVLKDAPIPNGSTLVAAGKDQKIILQGGDSVKVRSTDDASIDVVMSIMETDSVGITSDPVTYSITSNISSVDEGNVVGFTVSTSNVPNSTVLYWTTVGNVSSADFSDSVTSGNVTVTGGSATITRTLVADATTEGVEYFDLELRTGSTSGTIVATSANVTVVDTSLTLAQPTLTPSAASVDEGSSITITATNFTPDGFYYYSTTDSHTYTTTFSSFSISGGTGSFSLTPSNDFTTQGPTVGNVSVLNSSYVTVAFTTFTINDTSTLPASSLLLHFDSSPGLLVDSSSNALTMTNLGTKAVINTTTSKFGTASMQLTGSTFENTLTLTDSALPLVTTGSRVTFECWVYFDNVSTQSLSIRYSNSTVTNGFDLQLLSGGNTNINYWGTGATSTSYATGFTSGTWNHIAWAFHWGTSLYIFVNGIQRGGASTFSGLNNSRVTTTPKLQLVRNSGPSGNILIDEFRIVPGLIAQGNPANNGIQVFTPPTAPYTS